MLTPEQQNHLDELFEASPRLREVHRDLVEEMFLVLWRVAPTIATIRTTASNWILNVVGGCGFPTPLELKALAEAELALREVT